MDKADYGTVKRRKKYYIDDSLPPHFAKASYKDYSNSGYTKGHIVRSYERTATLEDNQAVFLMTNIMPQTYDLNAGPWLRLEEYCQKLCQKNDKELYIIAGGVFDGQQASIGNGVAVPTNFFKIVVILDAGQSPEDVSESTEMIAVIMPNMEGIQRTSWKDYVVAIHQIEAQTGYRLNLR